MDAGFTPEDKNVLLKIQNGKKPDQIVYLTLMEADAYFETWGLKHYFDLDEIRIASSDILTSLPEYAEVLSFLCETMSEAQDLGLPYTYQATFHFKGIDYSLQKNENYRLLKRSSPQ